MAELSIQEQEAIRAAVAEAFTSEPEAGEEAVAASTQDSRKVFCENWETVALVLQALATIVPKPAKSIIEIVLGIGNKLKKTICPA